MRKNIEKTNEVSEKRKVYVVFTDKYMSYWGCAKGKINKVIVECNDSVQAYRVMDNLKKDKGYKYINIHYDMPYYNPRKYLCNYYVADDASLWNK